MQKFKEAGMTVDSVIFEIVGQSKQELRAKVQEAEQHGYAVRAIGVAKPMVGGTFSQEILLHGCEHFRPMAKDVPKSVRNAATAKAFARKLTPPGRQV